MRTITLTKIVSDRFSDTDDPSEGIRTTPVSINPEAIRCFYPRRDNRPGTRITFSDGGGFAVSEPYTDVEAMVSTH